MEEGKLNPSPVEQVEFERREERQKNNERHLIAPFAYTSTRRVEISASHLREQRIVAPFDEGPLVDAYKILRTQLIHRMMENRWNVLGITSPGKGEGKTVTAVNLAISLSKVANQTVLLIDANLRNPGVHHLLGIKEEKGLVDYLVDEVTLEELLIHLGIGRFVVLPAGRKIQNSPDLLISHRMIELAKEVKHRYRSRMVIFDLPPLLQAADVLAFSPHIDSLLLVVEAGKTQEKEVERSLQILQGVPIIGTVLNKG
ncbi:MAG: CpsD/CapB family tyrosine-protein kinase [Nitrospiria bacterium]